MKTMTKDVFAAIDLGTNSCRLLIADRSGRTLYKRAGSCIRILLRRGWAKACIRK